MPSCACAGVAINPATAHTALSEIAGEIDLALCMTVNPGWGGQAFIAHSLEKIPRVRELVGEGVAVEVDGGIDPMTAPGVGTPVIRQPDSTVTKLASGVTMPYSRMRR